MQKFCIRRQVETALNTLCYFALQPGLCSVGVFLSWQLKRVVQEWETLIQILTPYQAYDFPPFQKSVLMKGNLAEF